MLEFLTGNGKSEDRARRKVGRMNPSAERCLLEVRDDGASLAGSTEVLHGAISSRWLPGHVQKKCPAQEVLSRSRWELRTG